MLLTPAASSVGSAWSTSAGVACARRGHRGHVRGPTGSRRRRGSSTGRPGRERRCRPSRPQLEAGGRGWSDAPTQITFELRRVAGYTGARRCRRRRCPRRRRTACSARRGSRRDRRPGRRRSSQRLTIGAASRVGSGVVAQRTPRRCRSRPCRSRRRRPSGRTSAAGATPVTPKWLPRLAAIVPATWVPWPLPSAGVRVVGRPSRSPRDGYGREVGVGGLARPVSTTATVSPAPVTQSHASCTSMSASSVPPVDLIVERHWTGPCC